MKKDDAYAIREYLKTIKDGNGGGKTTVSVSVGSTTTGAAGSNASVVNSGDDVDVVLDFTIPRGNTGAKGDQGVKGDTGDAAGFGTPTASVDGSVGTPSVDITASGSDTAKVFNFAFHNLKGVKGDKGDTGDAFHIVKTYASISAMNADYSGTDVKIGEYVMITSNVEDPDNAKVYIKGSSAYEFVVDMSGAAGIKGDKGDTGATGNGISTIVKTSTSGLVDTYTITFTDGTTSNFTVTNGAKGEDGNGISSVVLNQDYTLTLTFTDGTTYTTTSIRGATGATGATGNGISSIAKTGTSGLVDTYTITFTNGNTATFTVTNGEKGEKGDTFTYDDLTSAQKAEIKADLSAFYTKDESNYVTAQADEDTIPIGITGFRSTDILFVDINGLDLIEGEDYTISGTNIILETPISSVGQTVHFLALRAVAITPQDYSALKGDPGDVQDVLLDGTSVLDQRGYAILVNLMSTVTPKVDLSNYQVSGSDDKALYDAIVALGWQDVLES